VSKEADSDHVHYSDWSTLVGFLEESEALNHIQGQGVPLITVTEEWVDKIKTARGTTSKLVGRLSMQPIVRDFGPEYEQWFSQLRSEPTFPENLVGVRSSKFALVELARIHSYQLDANMEYVDSLLEKVPDPSDLSGTVKFCLPIRDEIRKSDVLSWFNSVTNTFCAVTQNLDFRVAGNVQGEDPHTHRPFAGFTFSTGLPQVSVAEYRGMYLVKNGHHRALALLKKGHQFLPCLLLLVDDYQFTGGEAPGVLPMGLVMSDKSPLLSDFLTPAAVTMPRRRLRIMISVHSEAQVVPV